MNLKRELFISLTATGIAITPFISSCRMIALSPEITRMIKPYQEILHEASPEEREKLVTLLEEGLKISGERHQKEIRDIVQAFTCYYQNDPNKGALVVVSDGDFAEYKHKSFDSLNEVLSFMRKAKKRANIYVSKINVLMIEYAQYADQHKMIYYFCIDYNANGMHEGEEDYFYSSEFLPGEAMTPFRDWNFEFEKEKKDPRATMKKDVALSNYKIIVHETAKILENQTDIGHLIIKYTLEALPHTEPKNVI
jgi:hypothetical protein